LPFLPLQYCFVKILLAAEKSRGNEINLVPPPKAFSKSSTTTKQVPSEAYI
jgi:hypothetical protein